MNLANVQSFDNGTGAAVSAYYWVTFNSSGKLILTDPTITDCVNVGTILQDRALTDVDPLDISLHNCGGVHWAVAGGAITAGAKVQLGTAGVVVTRTTLEARGIALNAASGAGSVIRVFVFPASGGTGAGVLPTQTSIVVPTTAATNTTPYGFSQVQANDIITTLNELVADVTAILTYLG